VPRKGNDPGRREKGAYGAPTPYAPFGPTASPFGDPTCGSFVAFAFHRGRTNGSGQQPFSSCATFFLASS
jgi:hypothetical protein